MITIKLKKFSKIFFHTIHSIWLWQKKQLVRLLTVISGNKKFLFNVCIGILIAVLFHFLRHTQFGESVFNKFLDISIKYWEINSDPNHENEILFVDIDQETYLQWGTPYFTPLDSLSNIISFAANKGAKVIFIDIDLDSRKKSFLGEQVEILLKMLGKLPDGDGYTHILFSTVPNKSDGQIRETIADSLINNKKNFHKVVPLVSKSGSDMIIRYMRYYQIALNESEQTELYWTPILLAAAIKRGVKKEYLDSLKEQILPNIINAGDEGKKYRIKWPNGDEIIMSNSDIFTNRIKFRYRFDENNEHNANLGLTERITFNRIYTNPDLFYNKIVIIGVSSPDLGSDIHSTPIGDLPGMYIIGNSMNVLLNNVQITPLNDSVGYFLEFFIILLAAFLFLKFDSVAAYFLSILIILFALAPATLLIYYKYGVFTDLIFPILGMSIHKSVSLIEGTFQQWKVSK